MFAVAQSGGCALEGAARLETAQQGSCLANCAAGLAPGLLRRSRGGQRP